METSKEELNTINIRLQEKVDELESTNNNVVNLLASASIATLFLDKGFRIKRFTPAITGLMSLIPTDLGRPIGDILMRFTDEMFLYDARRVLVDLAPLTREVQADDRAAVDAAYSWSIRESRDAYEIEHRVIRKHTGEIRFVHERCQHFRDASGSIIRSVGMVHDITERKRAEEALRKLNAELEERVAEQTAEIRRTCEAVEAERQRLYNVLELLPAYVVLLTPDYHVPFANRFFRERFGEAQGKRCYEFLFQRTEPCEICETHTVLKTGKPHHWEWTGPDGRNYDVHDFPFTDSDGAPFILEMGIDITEIKSAEAALKEANETLERRVAERTAEVEGFSYSVSHDLRASLRAIDGYSRMILRKHADRFDDDALGKFNVIRDNTRMMGQLIDDLLAFSRLGRAQLSKVMLDIGELIREIWEELKAINPDRRLTLKIAEIPHAGETGSSSNRSSSIFSPTP
jgi:PAS domain-containing protein